MILFRYLDPTRDVANCGYWFEYGGILRPTAPIWIAPMELDPGRNKDFVCCCKTMREVMAYFPITAHEKMNGVYGIYEYSGNLIQQRDSISEYVTADANKLKIIDMLSFDEAYKMG